MIDEPSVSYRFGPFQLEPAPRKLTRDGCRINLTARALDLLVYLIEQRHRAVRREELLARFWPDVVVEEANLTVNISLLRKLLGPQPRDYYVETLPRVGYRFCAPLDE